MIMGTVIIVISEASSDNNGCRNKDALKSFETMSVKSHIVWGAIKLREYPINFTFAPSKCTDDEIFIYF